MMFLHEYEADRKIPTSRQHPEPSLSCIHASIWSVFGGIGKDLFTMKRFKTTKRLMLSWISSPPKAYVYWTNEQAQSDNSAEKLKKTWPTISDDYSTMLASKSLTWLNMQLRTWLETSAAPISHLLTIWAVRATFLSFTLLLNKTFNNNVELKNVAFKSKLSDNHGIEQLVTHWQEVVNGEEKYNVEWFIRTINIKKYWNKL